MRYSSKSNLALASNTIFQYLPWYPIHIWCFKLSHFEVQFQDIGELWRYKNETLHAFIRGAEQQRRNCYLDTAVMRYCMIQYTKENVKCVVSPTGMHFIRLHEGCELMWMPTLYCSSKRINDYNAKIFLTLIQNAVSNNFQTYLYKNDNRINGRGYL